MGVPRIKSGPMTVEEFYAFTDTRPDDEKWELIDGEPILNASPSLLHQLIVSNVVATLRLRQREVGADWIVLPGLGIRISDVKRPEPDVLVIPRGGRSIDPQSRDRNDVIVASKFFLRRPATATCAGSARPTRACRRSPITS
jgi:Uma2 family endonuclease